MYNYSGHFHPDDIAPSGDFLSNLHFYVHPPEATKGRVRPLRGDAALIVVTTLRSHNPTFSTANRSSVTGTPSKWSQVASLRSDGCACPHDQHLADRTGESGR